MRRSIKMMDKPLFFSFMFMAFFGLFMIFSASYVKASVEDGNTYKYIVKQGLIIFFVGLPAYFTAIMVPLTKYKKWIKLIVLIIIASLSYLIIWGKPINNAKSWIDLGFFNLQPSEIAKSVIILYMAIYYSTKKASIRNYVSLLSPFLFIGTIIVLVALQPDLGTTIIIVLLSLIIFFSVPFDERYKKKLKTSTTFLVTAVVLVILYSYLSGGEFLNEHHRNRLNFIKPCDRYNEVGPGYQVCNGYIALNSSGLVGKGPGNSTQKYLYLPEAHTDFIFPIIVEELGLIVGIFLILLYAFIIYRILLITKASNNLMGGIIGYGVGVYLFLHILINMVGIFGLLPLTGVPLPFLSYGGSFTLNLFISMGLVQRVAIENSIHKKEEAIRNKIREQ